MNPSSRIPGFYLRCIMFALILALVVYVMHFILPGNADAVLPDIALNPIAQIGLFIVLSLGAALIGFWVIFGDVFQHQEK